MYRLKIMPGANCAIFGCNTSRIHKGISIFKVPKSVDDYSKKWRENVISVITRDRVIDQSLRRQIEEFAKSRALRALRALVPSVPSCPPCPYIFYRPDLFFLILFIINI